MRNLVIGDIHGSFKGLQQVVERADITYDDHVIFIGDAVDGWPDSRQVVDWLLEHPNLVWVEGNHDTWFQDWLWGLDPGCIWYDQGGRATLASYVGYDFDKFDLLKKIREKQTRTYRNLDGYVFVHGGLLGDTTWDRTMWCKYALEGPYGDPETIYVCGHTSLRSGEIERRHNVINVDSGAGFGGRLSCSELGPDGVIQTWYSDPSRELYPDHVGRSFS